MFSEERLEARIAAAVLRAPGLPVSILI